MYTVWTGNTQGRYYCRGVRPHHLTTLKIWSAIKVRECRHQEEGWVVPHAHDVRKTDDGEAGTCHRSRGDPRDGYPGQ